MGFQNNNITNNPCKVNRYLWWINLQNRNLTFRIFVIRIVVDSEWLMCRNEACWLVRLVLENGRHLLLWLLRHVLAWPYWQLGLALTPQVVVRNRKPKKKRKKHNIRAHLLFSLIVSISELILIYCFDLIVSALPQSFCSEMNNKIEDNLPHHHVGRISSNLACHRLRSSTAWSRGGAWLYPDCGLWRMGWCQVGSSHLPSRALSHDPERDHPAVRSWSPPWVSNRGLIEYSIWK